MHRAYPWPLTLYPANPTKSFMIAPLAAPLPYRTLKGSVVLTEVVDNVTLKVGSPIGHPVRKSQPAEAIQRSADLGKRKEGEKVNWPDSLVISFRKERTYPVSRMTFIFCGGTPTPTGAKYSLRPSKESASSPPKNEQKPAKTQLTSPPQN